MALEKGYMRYLYRMYDVKHVTSSMVRRIF
jgi:hypothetical protein